jgi:multidrug transporter EmrE-like cation transporter
MKHLSKSTKNKFYIVGLVLGVIGVAFVVLGLFPQDIIPTFPYMVWVGVIFLLTNVFTYLQFDHLRGEK